MSWVSELISRYSSLQEQQKPDLSYKRRQPLQFDVRRPAFDPSDYYRELQQFKDLSRLSTTITQQQAVNTAIQEREKEIARIRVSQPALNLSGTTLQSQPTSGKLGQPLGNYRFTSGYGVRDHPIDKVKKFHTGIDLAAPEGTPIYATHSGYVQSSGMMGGYGNLVILNNGSGLQTYYAHQSRLAVKSGQYVQQGQIIGYVGSTGKSTGPHLHYEVRVNGQHVNPSGYM